ncbi:MAG: PQQ-binding-like beta-propeller repeat protein [Flavobacteriales bacterium]
MARVYILFLVFFGSAFLLNGQIMFERTYGGPSADIGFCVQQTLDDGYALFGITQNNTSGFQDMYLIKTDEYGDTLWSHTYGTVNMDMGYSADETSDGGFILAGMFGGFGTDTLTLIRVDQNGDPIWTGQFPGTLGRDIGFSVLETSDGGFAVCGFTQGISGEDVYLVRTDANGNELWSHTVDLGGSEVGWAMEQTQDDGFIVLANSYLFADSTGDVHLIRFAANGDSLWTKTFFVPGPDESHGLTMTADGGFVIVGGNGYPSRDLLIIKADQDGNELWRHVDATQEDELGMDVKELPNGDLIIVGRRENITTTAIEMYMVCTNGSGAELWNRTYSHGIFSECNSMDVTSDGGFVLFGSTSDTLNGSLLIDMLLIKTDGAGYTYVERIADDAEPIVLYPNPANSTVWIEPGTLHPGQVSVVDASGKQLLHQYLNGVSPSSLDLGSLTSGSYWAVFTLENGGSIGQAFVIAK